MDLVNVAADVLPDSSIWTSGNPREELWNERRIYIFMAKLAAKAMRYDDMIEAMKKVAALSFLVDLNDEERKLLTDAYREAFQPRWRAWTFLGAVEKRELRRRGHESHIVVVRKLREKIESEMYVLCRSILGLLDNHLISNYEPPERQAFYWKMRGEYLQRLEYFYPSPENQRGVRDSYEIAERLTSTHPTELGLEAKPSTDPHVKDMNSLDDTSVAPTKEAEGNHDQKLEFKWVGVEMRGHGSSESLVLEGLSDLTVSDLDSVVYVDVVKNTDPEYGADEVLAVHVLDTPKPEYEAGSSSPVDVPKEDDHAGGFILVDRESIPSRLDQN